jgi:hypothetical protein
MFVAVPPASLSHHPFHIPVPEDEIGKVPLNLKGELRNGRVKEHSVFDKSDVIEIHEGHVDGDGEIAIAPKNKTFVFSISVGEAKNVIPELFKTILKKAKRRPMLA